MIDTCLYVPGLSYDQLPNDENLPLITPLTIGNLYRFSKEGVVLEMHQHSENKSLHYTIVLSGIFDLSRSDKRHQTIAVNDFVDFELNEPHRLVCRSPGVIFNGFKYGNTLASIDNRITSARQQLAQVSKELLSVVQSIT
jgi:hypothetical protein